MNSIRAILLVVILAGALGLMTGCAREPQQVVVTHISEEFVHFVDIYVMEGNKFSLTGGIEPVGPIMVFEGDRVIFNNMNSKDVTLTLPPGMFAPDEKMIEPDKLLLKPNKRAILKVVLGGDLTGEVKGKTDDMEIHGNPDLKVGEEP
jgi:hypothetical protein